MQYPHVSGQADAIRFSFTRQPLFLAIFAAHRLLLESKQAAMHNEVRKTISVRQIIISDQFHVLSHRDKITGRHSTPKINASFGLQEKFPLPNPRFLPSPNTEPKSLPHMSNYDLALARICPNVSYRTFLNRNENSAQISKSNSDMLTPAAPVSPCLHRPTHINLTYLYHSIHTWRGIFQPFWLGYLVGNIRVLFASSNLLRLCKLCVMYKN